MNMEPKQWKPISFTEVFMHISSNGEVLRALFPKARSAFGGRNTANRSRKSHSIHQRRSRGARLLREMMVIVDQLGFTEDGEQGTNVLPEKAIRLA